MKLMITLCIIILISVFSCYKYDNPLDPENIKVVSNPSFNPPGGTYYGAQSVTISCSTDGAIIRYTTNGTEPSESSSEFTNAISVTSSISIKAIAYKTDWVQSQISTASYTIYTNVATPTFDPPEGTYTTAQYIRILCSTSGAVIKYTLDGTEPSSSSSQYSSPISISSSTTIKAKAFRTGLTESNTATSEYIINLPQPIFVDHFNNLDAWTNTSNSTWDDPWFVSSSYLTIDAYNGLSAISNSTGANAGDVLSKSFDFTSNVVLKIWMTKKADSNTNTYIKVDGVVVIDYGEWSDYPYVWTQKQCTVSSGLHTITIETDFAGTAAIDELEIWDAK